MADPFTFWSQDPRARARRRPRPHPLDRQLTVRTSVLGRGVVVVSVGGEIDLANKADLASALTVTDSDLRLLVCDLTRVSFLACTGVSTLAETNSHLSQRGATLRVVAADPVVLRVLKVTGQHDLLGVHPTLRSALTGFVPPHPTNLARLTRRA
jgi:anti-sigma B factor antagonist